MTSLLPPTLPAAPAHADVGRGAPLPTQVREVIYRRVLAGEYRPGERLVETRLSRELQVSQGSVREALRQLEVVGLLEYTPHKGVTVHKTTPTEYAETALVRAVLEGAAAELAAARGMPTAPLKVQLAAMDDAARTHDLRSWVAAAVGFHRLILEGSGNAVLLMTWESLNIEARTIQVVLHPSVDLQAHHSAHQDIIEALDSRDALRAGTLSRAHEESYTPGSRPDA